jgi:UDP-glucuronate 4-epimerase
MDYIQNNIVATQNLIEVLEELNINKAIYASTSCVMAGNPLPWKEDEPTGHQLNPYGYTKRTNECQFKTSKIKQNIGLRFFTVYGPYGRPDMALFQFAEAAVKGKTIDVYNYGDMKRDFTYVDDIVNGIETLMYHILNTEETQAEIYNIGRGQQVQLMDFISEIEKNMGHEIKKNLVPRHPADTLETWSDTTKLQELGWKPKVSISEGVAKFCEWYKQYYGVNYDSKMG